MKNMDACTWCGDRARRELIRISDAALTLCCHKCGEFAVGNGPYIDATNDKPKG